MGLRNLSTQTQVSEPKPYTLLPTPYTAMGAHLPNLCDYTVAVIGAVFCGGYTTLDTETGLFC